MHAMAKFAAARHRLSARVVVLPDEVAANNAKPGAGFE